MSGRFNSLRRGHSASDVYSPVVGNVTGNVTASHAFSQKHLNTILGKVEDGSWTPDARITVRQLLQEHWLPPQRARGLRATTLAGYEGAINSWIVPRLGGLPVASLTPAVVVEFMAALRSEKSANRRNGLSARTVQLATGVLKSACAWAVQAEILGRNPTTGVRRPRSETKPMKVWTNDDARRFLEATREDRLAFAWALLLARGLRRGELAGLKWSAIDLDAGTLRIETTRTVVEGKQPRARRRRRASARSRLTLVSSRSFGCTDVARPRRSWRPVPPTRTAPFFLSAGLITPRASHDGSTRRSRN